MNQEKKYPDVEKSEENVRTPENLTPQESVKEAFKEFVWETVKIIIISLIIIIPIRYYVIQPFYVSGASMEPNFHDHEYLIIDEISYRFNEVKRGEIVVFRHPSGENNFYIKRIIGLPNERLVIKDGQVIIYNQQNPNGAVLDETEYLAEGLLTNGEVDVGLAENEYYVMGDNRLSSLDSRKFGAILRKDIVGKTWLRGWPIDRFKVFETPDY